MQLQTSVVTLHPVHTWTTARGTSATCQVVVVKLLHGDVWGLGEGSPLRRYGQSVETMAEFLGQVDASKLSFHDVPGSMAYVNALAPGHSAAKCALNLALVDGAARQAGITVHELLGLGFREAQHLTSFTIAIAEPAEIERKVLAAASFPILKLKFGGPDDRRSLAMLRAVEPKKRVRIDANEAWTSAEHALEMIEWLAQDGNVELVEQPMPAAAALADQRWLKERSPLPLIGDESYHVAADAARCAECFHGVNIKLSKAGGLTTGATALREARQLGLKTMLGCMLETSILVSAAAHLVELCDYLDLDGNLLVQDDPYEGVACNAGVLSFQNAAERFGLRVRERTS